MKFDATDFDQNTKKTMSTLDKLREKLSFKDVVDNNAMNTIADNVQKVADKAYTIVDRTIDKIKDNIANKLVNFIQDNTIGQLNAGWNKYADMTTSVATLTGQGYGLKQINEQLERLMYFTDETSFKFTDMVGEIGKFTASGQSLEDATTAMMGIAEWAALSGKNANEASRAMYQLSQALGAGQMRLVDWKSIQNLNMDTREFRQNAIDAAIAVGTLKDNLDGTYTTLVGKKKGSLSFNIREFSDKLTEGAWFTTEVMMEVYSKYSEAVDDIRDVYEKGYYFDADNKYVAINTTAEAVREIKKSNNELIKRFANEDEEGLKLTSDQINSILLKWKQVAKVVNHVNELDEEGNKIISDEDAAKAPEMYAEYLKEYSEIFQGTEEDARKALNDWEKYVAEFGMKAFEKSFEAKTFVEAIESAKDAASTVWVQIYQDIFGDYEQAKEIWTDLANTLYELFVNRLWDLQENIIGHWKTGGKSTLEKLKKEYKAQIEELRNSTEFGEAEAEQVRVLEAEIANLQKQIDEGTFRDGRKIFMQGIYGFGSGLKSVIMNFRDGWDSLFTTGETGDKLLNWSEKLRVSGFKFYLMMQDLAGGKDHEGPSPFYENLAKGVKNLFAPIAALRKIIHSVIQAFLPSGETFVSILNKLAYGFANLTAKIVPSQETIVNIARVLRGIIAFIKLIAKAVLGFYNATLKPIISTVYTAITETFGRLLELFAEVGDRMYAFEEGLDIFEAMEAVGEAIGDTLEGIWYLIKTIFGLLWKIVGPVLGIIYRTIKAIVDEIKQMSSGTGGFFGGLAEKFKAVAKRAHDAWFSVNSFKDVFNAYSDQKGLPAFLMMLTDMLDTLITKIGVTIAALFGLDETVANGKMSKGLQTLKDIIADIAIGIKWLYTNVIRPILGTLIEGLGASLHTLGNQWRTGDVKGFLGTIKQIISTFTSLGLLKFIGTINKVFGAGGLIRVFRNAAKAFKGLKHWLDAKALNEIAGSILKLAIAFAILAGTAAAISFLPSANIAKFVTTLVIFIAALVAAMVALKLIMKAANEARWGLFALAGTMLSIVLAVGIFIFAINKLHKALSSLFAVEEEYTDENGKTQTRTRDATGKEIIVRILSLLAPVLTTIASIAGIMKIISKLGGGATLIQMALTIAGLGIGVFMLVNAIDDMIDIFERDKVTPGKVIGAAVAIMGLFAILALITRILSVKNIADKGLGNGVKSAVALSIMIAAMAIVLRVVLIPTLETLADSAYSFWDYVAALLIIAGAMFTIAGTLALMSANTGSFLNKIASGIVFILFAKILQTVVVPLIELFASMDLNGGIILAIGAVAAVCFIISGAIQSIFLALAEIIKATARLKAKQLVPIILSIGGVIAGIMWLSSYLKKEGSLLNAEEIGLIIASISSVILVIGLFAVLLNKEFTTALNMKAFSKLIVSLTIMIAVIGVALAGLLLAVKSLYGENSDKGMVALLIAAGALVAVIGLSLLAFGAAVAEVTVALKGLQMNKTKQIVHLFYALFITIVSLVAVISLGAALIGAVYKNQTANLIIIMIGLVLGTLFLLTSTMYMMESVVSGLVLALKNLTQEKVKRIEVILGMTFIGIAAIMAIMALGTSLIGGILSGYSWETIIPMIGMAAGTILSFILVAEELEKLALILSGITPQKLQYIQSTLLLLFVTIAGIMLVIAGGTAAIASSLNGYTWESFVPTISIAVGAVIAFVGIASAFEKLATTMSVIQSFNLKNIIATMMTILVITGLMATIMTALMNWMAGSGVGGEQNLMNAAAIILATIIPFTALVGIIELMIPTAGPFATAAAKIAAGIFLIAAALSVFAGAAMLLRDAFTDTDVLDKTADGLDKNKSRFHKTGEEFGDEFGEGFRGSKEIDEHSPSEAFKDNGRNIDKGLQLGIKKDMGYVKTASKALAVATNESFQKELGIHSPSKVFYENGKFVIRGFINGAQSEYQKNKDMGAAMGEGFADSALEGMKDGWKGLWDGEEMADWIENFSKEGGLNFGEAAGESLFSAFLGTETTDDGELEKQLTAQEQQAIGMYEQKIKDLNWKIEGLTIHGKDLATYGASSEAIQANNHEIQMLKDEVAKYEKARDSIISKAGGKTKKRVGGIFGGLGDVFDGLGEEFGNIMSSSMLGSISEWFGEGGEGLKEITDTFNTALGTAGDTGASAFTSRIFEALGLDGENNTFASMGTLIGSSIGQGIADAIFGPIADVALRNPIITGIIDGLHFLGIVSDDVYNAWHPERVEKELLHSQNNALITSTMYSQRYSGNYANISDENWNYYMDTLRSTFKDTINLTASQIETEFLRLLADPNKNYNTVKKNGKDVLDVLKGKFSIYYDRIASDETEFNNALNSAIAAGIIDVNEYGMTVGEENIDALVKFIEDWFYISTSKISEREAFMLKQEAQKVINQKLSSSKLNSTDRTSILQILSDYDGYGANSIYHFNSSNFSNQIKSQLDDVFAAGFDVIDFLMKGFELGFLSWNGTLVELSSGTMSGIITALQKEAEEKSPSKKGIRIGAYLSEGVAIGIEEGSMDAINAASEMMTNATDLITDETIAGLNGMESMLDHEITPTITPVFDSSTLTNGVDTINSALDSVQPRVDSAIGSFGIESTDYTNNLTSLQNRIDTLTGVVDSFMTMIESGAGVNVKVSAEPDPTNIYNLVVDVNKQEFKRTGRNNFAF